MEKADKPQAPEEKKFKLAQRKGESDKSYTVREGDTLSRIAKVFYDDEAGYMKIYEANKDLIGPDMDKLKVGMELSIPPK
jgi:nucleoid-associated protein YgaU